MWVPHFTLLGGVLILSLSELTPAFAAVVSPRCANHTDPPYPYYLPDLIGLPTGSSVIPSNPSGTAVLTPGPGTIVGPTGASSSSFFPNTQTLTGGTVSRFVSSSTDTLLPTPLPSLRGTGSTSPNGSLIPSSFSRIRGTGPTISGSESPTVFPSIRGTSPLSSGIGLPITYPYIFNVTPPSFHGSGIGPLPTVSGRSSILTGSSGIGIGSEAVSFPTGSWSGTGNVKITASIATVSRNGTEFIVTGTGTGVNTISTVTGSRSGSGFIPTGTGGITVSILTGTTVSRGQIISVATSTISGTSFSPLSTGDIHSTSSSAPFANASSTDSVGSGGVTASSGEVSVTSVGPFTLTGTATFIVTSANFSVTLQTRIITSGSRTFTTITSDPSPLPTGGISRTSNTTNSTGQSSSIIRNNSPSGGLTTPVSPLYPFTSTGVPGSAGTGVSTGTSLSSIAAGSSSSTSGSLSTIFPSPSSETGLSSSSLSTDGPITTGTIGGPQVISPPGRLTSGGSLTPGSDGFPSVSGLPPGSITSGGLFTNDSILTTSRSVLIPGTFTSGSLIITDPASIPTQPIAVLPPISLSTDSLTFPVETPTSLSTAGSVVTDSASVLTESGLLSSSISTNSPITTSSATLQIDIVVSNGTLSTIGSFSTISYSLSVVTATISTGSFITNSASLPIVSTLPPFSLGGSLITPIETITPILSISTKGPLSTDTTTSPIIDPPASFSTIVTDLKNGTVTTRNVPVIGSLSSAEVVSTFGISPTTNSFTGTATTTRLPPSPIVPTSFETITKSTSATGPNPPVSTNYSYHHRRPHKGRPGPGWYNYYDPDFEFEDDFSYNY